MRLATALFFVVGVPPNQPEVSALIEHMLFLGSLAQGPRIRTREGPAIQNRSLVPVNALSFRDLFGIRSISIGEWFLDTFHPRAPSLRHPDYLPTAWGYWANHSDRVRLLDASGIYGQPRAFSSTYEAAGWVIAQVSFRLATL